MPYRIFGADAAAYLDGNQEIGSGGRSTPYLFRTERVFVTDGHVVSIDRYDGFKTIVSLAGSNIDLTDPCVRTATHLMSIYFGLVGFELWEKHRPCAGELTARQKDCLRWVREGKTAWEIGSILGVSARTVEEHLALACRRLGVRTRIQAVAEAALRGLIEL